MKAFTGPDFVKSKLSVHGPNTICITGPSFVKTKLSISVYGGPSLSTVLLSAVLVALHQPRSENVRWKVPEKNNL